MIKQMQVSLVTTPALYVGRIALDLTCTIPIATITTTFGYSAGVQIEAKVSATNAIATSTSSLPSTALVVAQTIPTGVVVALAATSTINSITVNLDRTCH